MSKLKTSHKEKNLVTISSFAKRKGVTIQAVRHQINKLHNIELVLIGMDKHKFIDWSIYKDFSFNDNKKNR